MALFSKARPSVSTKRKTAVVQPWPKLNLIVIIGVILLLLLIGLKLGLYYNIYLGSLKGVISGQAGRPAGRPNCRTAELPNCRTAELPNCQISNFKISKFQKFQISKFCFSCFCSLFFLLFFAWHCFKLGALFPIRGVFKFGVHDKKTTRSGRAPSGATSCPG